MVEHIKYILIKNENSFTLEHGKKIHGEYCMRTFWEGKLGGANWLRGDSHDSPFGLATLAFFVGFILKYKKIYIYIYMYIKKGMERRVKI